VELDDEDRRLVCKYLEKRSRWITSVGLEKSRMMPYWDVKKCDGVCIRLDIRQAEDCGLTE